MRKDTRGFTLIELVIAILILAIIVAAVLPKFVNIMNNSRKSSDVTNAKYLVKTVQDIVVNDPRFTTCTGRWEITKTNIQPLGTASTDFADSLKAKLVVGRIIPKYMSITSGGLADRYIIEIVDATSHEIKIYASNGTDHKEIYPITDSEYELK